MSEAVEQRGCHLGVAEDGGPLAEGEVGGDDDRGLLVEAADEMEEKLTAGLREGQIAELIEADEVEAGEMIGGAALSASTRLGLETIDEIDDVEKRPRAPPRMQLRAMAIARCVLPVPVPPTRTALRCWPRKAPVARSRMSASLIGAPTNSNSARSFASGSLAMPSW